MLVREQLIESILESGNANSFAGLGWCASKVADELWGGRRLKVKCEPPREIAILTPVELVRPDGRIWRNRLGDAVTYLSYPTNTWLSPLNRRQTSFKSPIALARRISRTANTSCRDRT